MCRLGPLDPFGDPWCRMGCRMVKGRAAPWPTLTLLVVSMQFVAVDAQSSDGQSATPDRTVRGDGSGPSIGETVEYIGAKLCHWGRGAGPSVEVSDGRMTAANQSAVLLDLGGQYEEYAGGKREYVYGGTDWTEHPYAARIEVELSDLSTEVGEATLLEDWPNGSRSSAEKWGWYAVAVRCATGRANCMRTLDYVGEDGRAAEPVSGGMAKPVRPNEFWASYGEWWDHWAWRDSRITRTVNMNSPGRNASVHEFVVCDLESAGRVRRALEHLIRLGGGRDELF